MGDRKRIEGRKRDGVSGGQHAQHKPGGLAPRPCAATASQPASPLAAGAGARLATPTCTCPTAKGRLDIRQKTVWCSAEARKKNLHSCESGQWSGRVGWRVERAVSRRARRRVRRGGSQAASGQPAVLPSGRAVPCCAVPRRACLVQVWRVCRVFKHDCGVGNERRHRGDCVDHAARQERGREAAGNQQPQRPAAPASSTSCRRLQQAALCSPCPAPRLTQTPAP